MHFSFLDFLRAHSDIMKPWPHLVFQFALLIQNITNLGKFYMEIGERKLRKYNFDSMRC